MKYFAGLNEEGPFYIGPCDSEEDAIADASSEYADQISEGSNIVLGISKTVHVQIDAESLLENTAEQMYDELYEDALDGWCDKMPREQWNSLSADLTKVVVAWLEKNNQESSFEVIDSYKKIPNDQTKR